jgi:outer membrane protein OmpA-like peptidoglycan-associated protein
LIGLGRTCNKQHCLRSVNMRILFFLFLFSALSTQGQTDTLRVYFKNDSYALSDSARAILSSIDQRVHAVYAYCDQNGSIHYNDLLAQKRATSVLEAITADYLNEPTIHLIGKKMEVNPVSYNHHHWRRVDVIVEKPVDLKPVVEVEAFHETALIEQLSSFQKDSTLTEKTIDLTIQFYPGLPIVLPEFEGQLFILFDFLRYNTDVSAEIHGHVCCADDYPLSYHRAHMVYQFLIDRSISPKRLRYEGFSNRVPKINPEITDIDRQQNRRVEVVVRKNAL